MRIGNCTCHALTQIATFKLNKKKELFEQLIRQIPNTMDLYPILRLIFPDSDTARGAYGLKEHALGRLFADVMALPERETKRLLGWKDPNLQARHNCTVGDFPSVLLSVIEPRMPSIPQKQLTIKDVNTFLTSLYESTDPDTRKDLFRDLVYKASPVEIKWIIRMILKDMKIFIGVETILRHLHPQAVNIYHISNSLKQVLSAIAHPTELESNIPKVTSIYFQPFRPMLSEKVSPGDVEDVFSKIHGDIFLEPKIDGERMIVHVDKRLSKVSIVSRNGIDFTSKYGDHQLSPIVLENFKGLGAVFDGELVAWDSNRQKIFAFGSNRDIGKSALAAVERLDSQTDSVPTALDGNLFYIVFDLIYYVDIDGKEHDLRAVPIADRRELVERILVPVPHRFELVKYQKCPCEMDEVKRFLKEALDRGEEGIVVKKAKSEYKLSTRGMGWFKIKADYDETFTDTIDLVVLGGFFSDSTPVDDAEPLNSITSFLMGAPEAAGDEKDVIIRTVAKVSSGLSQSQLVFVRNFLRDSVIPYGAGGSLPNWFGGWKPRKDNRPDILVSPWQSSLVFEVRAGEVTLSGDFSSGYTLRFPRIVKIRTDKDWRSATSFAELREMASRDPTSDRIFIQSVQKMEVGRKFGVSSGPVSQSPKASRKRTKKEVQVIEPHVVHKRSDGLSRKGVLDSVSVFVVNGPRVSELASSLGAEFVEDYAAPSVPVAEWNDSRVAEFVEATGVPVIGIGWL